MRKIYTVEERNQVRAYYAWLNGSDTDHVGDWLAAETKEIQLADRRAKDAARRAKPISTSIMASTMLKVGQSRRNVH